MAKHRAPNLFHQQQKGLQQQQNSALAIGSIIQQALIHQQNGQLAMAEHLYRQVLEIEPHHFDALHLLGIVNYQSGQHQVAAGLIQKAIQTNPAQPAAYSNLGLVLVALNKHEEALASYDRAIALQPGFAEAFNNRGIALMGLNRPEEALISFERALVLNPGYANAFSNRGDALERLHRHAEALESYDHALALQPELVEALNNRGEALKSLGRNAEALESYDHALALKPDFAEACNHRGIVLVRLNRLEEALASFDRALALLPDYADAFNNRGNTLIDLNRPDEALNNFDQALALRPGYADALSNRGNALLILNRHEEALDSYDQALALNPAYAEAHFNRGIALLNQKRHTDALVAYNQALVLNPGYAAAHFNKGLCHLLLGNFEAGWKEFEWRWQEEQLEKLRREFIQPLWLGEQPIDGKKILLHAEQGLGDTIHFCRYAKLVAAKGASVILQVQRPLKALLSNLEGVDLCLADNETLPDFDYHCPLLSLPLALDTRLESIPADIPYLFGDAGRIGAWQGKLGARILPRIGLAWSGNSMHKNDRNRSMPLAGFLQLLSGRAQFFSLQKELPATDDPVLHAHPEIRHFGEDLRDFTDTAALIELMDLVITVDTSVAHLAGAMGKAVWVLLPANPDWRWMLERDDSPWYPGARLFRQSAAGDWASVMEQVKNALNKQFPG